MRRRRFIAGSLGLAGAMALRSLGAQPATPKRVALVIAVHQIGVRPNQAPEFKKLNAAVSSATLFADWLKKPQQGFQVDLLTDENKPVRLADVEAAVKACIDRKPDVFLIYFVGHGFYNNYAERWLLSEAPAVSSAAVNLDLTEKAALTCGVPNVVIISEACRSTVGSLRMNNVTGANIMPNNPAAQGNNVDVFLATGLAEDAWEIERATQSWVNLYTTTFLEVFQKPPAGLVTKESGQSVVLNRNLGRYLGDEVPRRAKAAKDLVQRPFARVCSDVYIGTVDPSQMITTLKPFPGLCDLGLKCVSDVGLLSLPPPFQADDFRELEETLQLDEARRRLVQQREIGAKAGKDGLVVLGKKLVAAETERTRLDLTPLADGSLAAVPLPAGMPMANVLLRFADDSSTVLPALRNFVGVIGADATGISSVLYLPTGQNPVFNAYNTAGVFEPHDEIASAAKLGLFRLHGNYAARSAQAERLSTRIRIGGRIDPTLALYAAYAYADAGLPSFIKTLHRQLREDWSLDFFDVAMLANMQTRDNLARSVSRLFSPLLSRGWNLAALGGPDGPRPPVAENFLQSSLWTTFTPAGLAAVQRAFRPVA